MTQSEIEAAKIKKDKDIAADKLAQQQKEHNDNVKLKLGELATKVLPSSSVKLNDVEWYRRLYGNPKVNDTIPSFQQGEEIDPNLDNFGSLRHASIETEANPGVFQVAYIPTVGQQDITREDSGVTVDSGINESLSRLKAQLEKRNSRITTYSNDTIGRYIVGVQDGPITQLELLKVAIDVFAYANAIYPTAAARIITALGFDYDDFEAHIANYRDIYAKYSAQVNESLPMFNDLAFSMRRNFCAGNILRDSDNTRAQYLVMSPTHYAVVQADDTVAYKRNFKVTYDTFVTDLRTNYRRWTKGATWRAFIRDLRGSVDASNFFSLPVDPDTSTTEITVVDEVLAQFHNITTYPCLIIQDTTAGTILFDDGSLTLRGDSSENVLQGRDIEGHPEISYRPGMVQYGFATDAIPESSSEVAPGKFAPVLNKALNNTILEGQSGRKLINQYKDFDDGDVMVDTRMLTVFEAGVYLGEHVAVVPKIYGTEVILSIIAIDNDYVSFKPTSDDNSWEYMHIPCVNISRKPTGGSFSDQIGIGLKTVLCSSYFLCLSESSGKLEPGTKTFVMNSALNKIGKSAIIDWFPIMSVYVFGVSTEIDWENTSEYYQNVSKFSIGELDTYTFLSDDLLTRLHKQAAVSEFAIPASAILAPLK